MCCVHQSEKAKRNALAHVGEAADVLVESANSEVHKIFCQEKEIEVEVRQFTATAARYATQQQQWAALFRSFYAALKVRDKEVDVFLSLYSNTKTFSPRFPLTSPASGACRVRGTFIGRYP